METAESTFYMKLGYIKKLPISLCLALSLFSVFAHADDSFLIKEANTALAQKDYSSAFSKFSVIAHHGNAIAQFNLGAFYLNGQGVRKDEKQAFDWFKKSATQGNARALQVIKRAAESGNEYAKNAYSELTRSTTAAAPAKVPDVKVNTPIAATPPRARQSVESYSSGFSLGVSLGKTGELTGINNSPSIGLLVGYKFNSSFSVELAYNALYRDANADIFLSAANPGTTGTFDLNAISMAGQYTYGLTSKLLLLGNLGFHRSSFEMKSPGTSSITGSSNGLVAGLKVQYNLGKSVGIRGGFDAYTQSGGITGAITEIGLTMIYNFYN